jgi:hypothetical protein
LIRGAVATSIGRLEYLAIVMKISGMADGVGAFVGRKRADQVADGLPERLSGQALALAR